MTDPDELTAGDVLARLTDAARLLDECVDALAALRHARTDDYGRDELRTLQSYAVAGWSNAATARMVLQALQGHDAARHPMTCPGCPDCMGIPVGDL